MTDHEYYARPGHYLDTDDHARLIDEDPKRGERRARRIGEKIRKIDAALEVVGRPEERAELRARRESLMGELEELRP